MIRSGGGFGAEKGPVLFLYHPSESDTAKSEAPAPESPVQTAPVQAADSEKSGAKSVPAASARNAGELSLPPGYKDLGGVLGDLLLGQARIADEMEKSRRQMSQEDEFARFAKQSVQFIDAMDRMIMSAKVYPNQDEIARWMQGVESAYQKMLKLMEKFGLTVVSCDGQTVDVAKHDVVEYRATADYPHDTVMETVLKGIVLRGKILRDARVIVACNRSPETAAASKAGEGEAKGS